MVGASWSSARNFLGLSKMVCEAGLGATVGKLIWVLAKSRDLATALAAVGDVSCRYSAASSLNLLVSSTDEFKMRLILCSCSGVRCSRGSTKLSAVFCFSLSYTERDTVSV